MMQKFLNEQAIILDEHDDFIAWLKRRGEDTTQILSPEKYKQLRQEYEEEDQNNEIEAFGRWLSENQIKISRQNEQKEFSKYFAEYKKEKLSKERHERELEHYIQKVLNMKVAINQIDARSLKHYKNQFEATIEQSKKKFKALEPTEEFYDWLDSKGIGRETIELGEEITNLLLKNFHEEMQTHEGIESFFRNGKINDPNLSELIDNVQIYADQLNIDDRNRNRGRGRGNRRGRGRGNRRGEPSLFDVHHPRGCQCARCSPNWMNRQQVKISRTKNLKIFNRL